MTGMNAMAQWAAGPAVKAQAHAMKRKAKAPPPKKAKRKKPADQSLGGSRNFREYEARRKAGAKA